MRNRRKKFPSLKLFLVSLNLELDQISENYINWCGSTSLSPFEKCVIVLEDRRYFKHSGVDFVSVCRELWKRLRTGRSGGASTVDMQFVRTVNNRKELTLTRKYREMLMAWLANYHFDKLDMLRSYLAIAYFGHSLTGADEAAFEVFGKSPDSLNYEEGAFLAAMLVYPRPSHQSDAWQRRVERRAAYALRLMPGFEKSFNQIAMA